MPARVQLRGLHHLHVTHPFDAGARRKMEMVPLVPQVGEFLSGAVDERREQFKNLSSALRVGPRQYPDLYRRFVGLAAVLDVPKLPHLFVTGDPELNARASGVRDYTVSVTGQLLDVMTEEEVDFILAHELGHIKCDHMKWKQVAHQSTLLGVTGITVLSQGIGGALGGWVAAGGMLAAIAATIAILEWSRKAEFSADRVGLLGGQSLDAALSALAKLSVGTVQYRERIDVQELQNQALALEDLVEDSLVAKLSKFAAMLHQTHPYIPMRLQEIERWHAAGDYARLLSGEGRGEIGGSEGVWGLAPPPPPPAPA